MKWVRRAALVLLVLVVLAGIGLGAGYVWLRGSLPQYAAAVPVNGVAAPVRIVRDAHAVPHIFAESEADAAFAVGFVHAQDRLFQMEMARRLGAGRLAEVLGGSAVRADHFMRILGLHRLAEGSVAGLAPEVQTLLERYAAGVNAWLAGHDGPWPPEFYALGIEPEPWRPADSLVVGRLMALQLASNFRSELLRARLAETIGRERLEDLFPNDRLPPLTTLGTLSQEALATLHAGLPDPGARGASNAWAVAGTGTETGAPILVNDPHLGLGAPILWYLVRLETPELTLAGATIPGAPVVILGHNGTIAWGLTTTGGDTQDLFIERLDPDAPGRYLTPDGSAPFETRQETILVDGGDPVVVTVRATRHGPVVSDAEPDAALALLGDQAVVALAFPGLAEEGIIAEAVYRINHARDWDDFRAAMAHWIAPQQNVFYADTGGNIGMFVAGRVPVRADGNGLMPVPGWTGAYDWTGFIPVDDLPQVLNPPSGRIVNANNPVVGPEYPYLIAAYPYELPFRALRIEEMLDESGVQSLENSLAHLMDALSPAARDLAPLLTGIAAPDERAAQALALLRDWDFVMAADRPEPLLFTAWLNELNRALYTDEINRPLPAGAINRALPAGEPGLLAEDFWDLHPATVRHMLTEAQDWCDDVTTWEVTETCDEILRLSLQRSLDLLSAAHGGDISAWRWGDVHTAALSHRIFGRVPVLRGLVDLSVPTDGGNYTVNRGGIRAGAARQPFLHVFGAGFRGVYDLADLDRSRFIIATGQAGNPLSPHFSDLVEAWRTGGAITLSGSADELAASGSGTLMLQPQH